MKKKIYMIPATEVVELMIQQQMLAGSTLGVGDPVDNASGAESREDEDLWTE